MDPLAVPEMNKIETLKNHDKLSSPSPEGPKNINMNTNCHKKIQEIMDGVVHEAQQQHKIIDQCRVLDRRSKNKVPEPLYQ